MKIFLAGVAPWRYEGIYNKTIYEYNPYILESFYYVNDRTKALLPHYGDFMLDSGAYTFMNSPKKKKESWEGYIYEYANFIRENNVQKFFELDLDSVVGIKKTMEYREMLEDLTRRPCIPVWHKTRGMEQFVKDAQRYSYVAIGGIVNGEIAPEQYGAFPALIREAHKYGAQIHGLGYMAVKTRGRIRFDSVDSTSWTTGNRFGYVYKFNGRQIIRKRTPNGKKMADPKEIAVNNFTEWVKYQKYAERKY